MNYLQLAKDLVEKRKKEERENNPIAMVDIFDLSVATIADLLKSIYDTEEKFHVFIDGMRNERLEIETAKTVAEDRRLALELQVAELRKALKTCEESNKFLRNSEQQMRIERDATLAGVESLQARLQEPAPSATELEEWKTRALCAEKDLNQAYMDLSKDDDAEENKWRRRIEKMLVPLIPEIYRTACSTNGRTIEIEVFLDDIMLNVNRLAKKYREMYEGRS